MEETINIWFIITVSLTVMVVGAIWKLSRPDICPECGEEMKHRIINGEDYLICPKCEERIKL